MKKVLLALALVAAQTATAAPKLFDGSNTLKNAIDKALSPSRSGYGQYLEYQGTGSGNGEKGLVNGDFGIAPMSREIKPEAAAALAQKGHTLNVNVLALDAVTLFVKADHPVPALSLPQIVDIFSCSITKWEDNRLGATGRTGTIKVVRRDDASGTTDAFKSMTGLRAFGPCVQDVSSTDNVADVTSRDPLAIGYAGRSGERFGDTGAALNRAVKLSKTNGGTAVLPTDANIRSFTYPLARKLYVYSVPQLLTQPEAEFLAWITDRVNMDPIMMEDDFVPEN